VHRSADRESETLIKRNGREIVAEHVKERPFAAIEYRLRDRGDEIVGIPVTTMIRMGAHGADFRKAFEFHALARHRDQVAFETDAEIVSQFVGPHGERTRPRSLDECEHVLDG